jgi:hypothetical protein
MCARPSQCNLVTKEACGHLPRSWKWFQNFRLVRGGFYIEKKKKRKVQIGSQNCSGARERWMFYYFRLRP